MNLLSEHFTLETVRLDVDVSSRKRLFEECALLFESAYGIPHDEAFEAIFEREKLGSTNLGEGCGIPHGRIDGLAAPAVVFIRLKTPLACDSEEPLRLIISILAPNVETGAKAHLALLRETAVLLQDASCRRALSEAPDAETVCRFIHGWEPPADLHD